MTTLVRSFLAVSALTIGLSACGNGNGNTTTPPVVVPPVVTPPVTVESKFGACFATKFDAGPFTKATDPVPCPDLAPLSLTTKPIAI